MSLPCGKYEGNAYQDVETDRRYCAWVLSLSRPGPQLDHFARYLKEKHGGILKVGRHRWKFFDEVARQDHDYCMWARSLHSPDNALQPFVAYLRSTPTGGAGYEAVSMIASCCNPRSQDCKVSTRRWGNWRLNGSIDSNFSVKDFHV